MIPGFGTLERMLFWELVRVFTLALIGLTGLFVIAGLIQQASQQGLSARQILQIIPLFIPSTLPYTIPATTLFASCVVYGRFSNDNEAVAVKAAGIDLLTMLRPAFLLGVLTMATTAAISFTLIPRTQVMMYEEIMRDPEEVLYNRLKKDRFLRGDDYMLYVRDVQGKRLLDVVIKRKSKTKIKIIEGFGGRAEYDFLARTQQARLSVDLERKIVTIDADRWLVADNNSFVISDGTRPMENELPDVFSAREIKNKPMALEWNELGTRVQELSTLRLELMGRKDKQIALTESTIDPAAKKLQAAEVTHFDALLKDNIRNIRNTEYEFYIRPALAAGCLVFALIGCPVGIYFNRADYLSSFVTCFLPTVFLYYPLLLSGGGMAKDGKIPMLLGVWGANMIMGTLALILIFRLIKR
jgi:lipopolysaccharide export system permease protein